MHKRDDGMFELEESKYFDPPERSPLKPHWGGGHHLGLFGTMSDVQNFLSKFTPKVTDRNLIEHTYG